MSSLSELDNSYSSRYLATLALDLSYLDSAHPSVDDLARSVEAAVSEIPLFFEQSSTSLSQMKESVELYDELAAHYGKKKGMIPLEIGRDLESLLAKLKPSVQQVVEAHPSMGELSLLKFPELFYSSPDVVRERFSYLRNPDFIFFFARNLQYYSSDHHLPSPLIHLYDELKGLKREELIQLGVIIDQEQDRNEFSKVFGLNEVEILRPLYLKNFQWAEDTYEAGVCFGLSLYLISQYNRDSHVFDWKMIRFLQNLSQFAQNHEERLWNSKSFELFEERHPDYMTEYPAIMNFAAQRLGYANFEEYQSDSNDDSLLLLRKIVSSVLSDPTISNLEVRNEKWSIKKVASQEFKRLSPSDATRLALATPAAVQRRLGLHGPELLLENQSIDLHLLSLLDSHQDGDFLILFPGHAIFLSLSDKSYCDLNDFDIIERMPRMRNFESNEEMLSCLKRYLQIRYLGRLETFSLARVNRQF